VVEVSIFNSGSSCDTEHTKEGTKCTKEHMYGKSCVELESESRKVRKSGSLDTLVVEVSIFLRGNGCNTEHTKEGTKCTKEHMYGKSCVELESESQKVGKSGSLDTLVVEVSIFNSGSSSSTGDTKKRTRKH
jgi:hypothetical protein